MNRSAKVQRLKNEQQDVACQEGSLNEELKSLMESKNQSESIVTNAANIKNIRDGLVSKKHQMYEQVIASTAPTQRYIQLQQNITIQIQHTDGERAIYQSIDQTQQMIGQALGLFETSAEILRRAEGWNRAAQFENFVEGEDIMEFMEQRRRDELINEARIPAIEAYQIVVQAWHTFPVQVKARYPAQAAQIGIRPLPLLQGADFGGTLVADMFGSFGAAVNDYQSGCKIRQNMQVVQQCYQMLQQQIELVRALQGAIQTRIAMMENNSMQLEQQRDQEKEVIFQSARQQAMQHQYTAPGNHIPQALTSY